MLRLHDPSYHLRSVDLAVEFIPIERIFSISGDEDEGFLEAFVVDGAVDWSIEAKTAYDVVVVLDCDCCC